MHRKLRDVFHRKSNNKLHAAQSEEVQGPDSEVPSKHVRLLSTPEKIPYRGHSDASKRSSQTSSRSRPLISIYSDRRDNNVNMLTPQAVGCAKASTYSPVEGNKKISNGYKVNCLTPLSMGDASDQQYMTPGGDRRLITGESDERHEGDVADRNTDRSKSSMDDIRRKPLPLNSPMSSGTSTSLYGLIIKFKVRVYIKETILT